MLAATHACSCARCRAQQELLQAAFAAFQQQTEALRQRVAHILEPGPHSRPEQPQQHTSLPSSPAHASHGQHAPGTSPPAECWGQHSCLAHLPPSPPAPFHLPAFRPAAVPPIRTSQSQSAALARAPQLDGEAAWRRVAVQPSRHQRCPACHPGILFGLRACRADAPHWERIKPAAQWQPLSYHPPSLGRPQSYKGQHWAEAASIRPHTAPSSDLCAGSESRASIAGGAIGQMRPPVYLALDLSEVQSPTIASLCLR